MENNLMEKYSTKQVKQVEKIILITFSVVSLLSGCVPMATNPNATNLSVLNYLRAYTGPPLSAEHSSVIITNGGSCNITFYDDQETECYDQTINGANVWIAMRQSASESQSQSLSNVQYIVEVPPGSYKFIVTNKGKSLPENKLISLKPGKTYLCNGISANIDENNINEYNNQDFSLPFNPNTNISIKQWSANASKCSYTDMSTSWTESEVIKYSEMPLNSFLRDSEKRVSVPISYIQTRSSANLIATPQHTSTGKNILDLHCVKISGILLNSKTKKPASNKALYYIPLTSDSQMQVTFANYEITNPGSMTDENGKFTIIVPSALSPASKVFTIGLLSDDISLNSVARGGLIRIDLKGRTHVTTGQATIKPEKANVVKVDDKIQTFKTDLTTENVNLGEISLSE